jgi:hypothetical protein
MYFRSTALLLALLSSVAPGLAQTEEPPAPTQNPDRPTKTPEQRMEELRQEQTRLNREIEFVRERVSDSKARLQAKLKQRSMDIKSIDAGKSANAPTAQAPARRPAVLMSEEQVAAQGKDTLMLVEGQPIRQSDLDGLMQYMEQSGTAPTADVRQQRAVLELVRTAAVMGSLGEATADALRQMQEARAAAEGGEDFVEVAKKFSRGPLVDDAKLTFTRNCPYGLAVERAVFATAPGQMTDIIAGQTSFILVKVEKVNSSDEPLTATVEGRVIMIPYHPDPTEIQQVQTRVALGQASMQLRDKQVLEILPTMLRPSGVAGEKPTQSDSDAAPKADDAQKAPVKHPLKKDGQ